ncbi:hypothetical protein ACQEXU_06360 [Vibrio sp. TRT 21S02]|uniref:hypothetical protein n=1 Tax=unclassified Vibrio TaxID=2614977 RepID=UPI003CE706A6
MEFEIYMPCEPAWICDSFLFLFAGLFILGLIGFIRILFLEYRKIQRAQRVRKRRQTHYTKRKK